MLLGTVIGITGAFLRYFLFGLLALSPLGYANYSYHAAEQQLLAHSPALLASQALQEAGNANAKALAHLQRPTVAINGYGLIYEQSAEIPVDRLNGVIAQKTNELNGTLDNFGLAPVAPINLAPRSVHSQGEHFGANISLTMPLYTGGLIDSVQAITQINADIQALNASDTYSSVQLALIKQYFDVQLKHALLINEKTRFDAIDHHTQNAIKLEQQGFISKGQRLQFEVARNQALRLYQLASDNHKSSLFALRVLLQKPDITNLSTPLFINPNQQLAWQSLLAQHANSPFMQKLQYSTQLAEQKVKLAASGTKPKVFAMGQYNPRDNDWFVGVMARYELLPKIDYNQKIYASEQEQIASLLSVQQITDDTHTLMHRALLEFDGSKTTHRLLTHNLSAAKENLRIQTLAFQEGVGTVSGLIDAEATIAQTQSEQAINAYRHIMALATLLHATGTLNDFGQYASLPDSIRIY